MSLHHLKTLCENLQSSPILNTVSPASHPRRAGVAAILRWKIHNEQSTKLLDTMSFRRPTTTTHSTPLTQFIDQMTLIPGELELLYIQRTKRPGDLWSGQVAFPGGKSEENETDIDTAMREVEEEIGLDLSGPDFLHLGKLDDKTITSLENKFMMILVPFVFLQLTPETPPLTIQPDEVAAVHWIKLHYLLSTPVVGYDPFSTHIPDTQRLLQNPRPGIVQVPSITLPVNTDSTTTIHSHRQKEHHDDGPVVLWGLTLRMTQQLMEFAANEKQTDAMVITYNNNNNDNDNGRYYRRNNPIGKSRL